MEESQNILLYYVDRSRPSQEEQQNERRRGLKEKRTKAEAPGTQRNQRAKGKKGNEGIQGHKYKRIKLADFEQYEDFHHFDRAEPEKLSCAIEAK